MKVFLKLIVIVMLILFAASYAFALQKMYNFSSGTKIKSAEVNKNFDDLYDNVFVVKANGAYIGTLVSVDSYFGNVTVMNSSGYVFSIKTNDGTIYSSVGTRYYPDGACGSSYYYADVGFMSGTIVYDSGLSGLYYVPIGAASGSYSYSSTKAGGAACTGSSGTINNAFTVYPNNPPVTGISSTSFAKPITIERR